MDYIDSLAYAQRCDAEDPLATLRAEFLLPTKNEQPAIYLCGNSLGLQPKQTSKYVQQELDDWARYGVDGHTAKTNGWLPYHELVTNSLAKIVGAKPTEVVAMNSLTTNLHLLLVSFYRPTKARYKILMEQDAFPSDIYAIKSQLAFHGFDPAEALITVGPRPGHDLIAAEDILATIDEQGDQIALILLGQPNYLTGQAFNTKAIALHAHQRGCLVGLDLAHAAGNLALDLHAENIDFAVWCHYKYMNGGPGTIAGAFVHERHCLPAFEGPRFAGWWGNNKERRFAMESHFDPIPGVESWQLSNPPILQLAALRAALAVFERTTMQALRTKSIKLTGYLEFLLEQKSTVSIITPSNPEARGCQLSLRFHHKPQEVLKRLEAAGVICDFRQPDIIRVAPTPLYNSYQDVYSFCQLI